MISSKCIVRIDRADGAAVRARDAERALFRAEGLSYAEHDVDVEGLCVRVLEVGKGEPVVAIGGGTGEAWPFAHLIRHFPDRRMLLVNRPGGGLSDGVDHRRVDLRELALATLDAVYDHFSLPSAPIIGHGMGGLWSIWFSIDRPGRVPVMAELGCPALTLTSSAPAAMRRLSVPFFNRLLVKQMIPRSVDDARNVPLFLGHSLQVATEWPAAAAECAFAFGNLPTVPASWTSLMEAALHPLGTKKRYRLREDELKRVRVPVVFIWGRRDPFGGLDIAAKVLELVPNAVLHEMPGGHMPWLDDARQCAEWIRTFFEDVQGGVTTWTSAP